MNVFELAKRYYPGQWDLSRIEALVAAGKLTRAQADSLTAPAEQTDTQKEDSNNG